MTKLTSKNNFVNFVLCSTLFICPYAMATSFGPGTFAAQNTAAQTDNVVQVLPTGQILSAGTAVTLNSVSGRVTTLPNNTFVGFSSILSNAGDALQISASNGVVNLGASSGAVSLNGHAINITNTGNNAQITNAGLVLGTNNFSLLNNGLNTTITNTAGGTIAQRSINGGPIRSTANNLSLINYGTITQSGPANVFSAIRLEAPFTHIINMSGGVIQSLNGTGTSHAIDVVNASSGDIINNTGGLLYADTTSGNAIHINSATTGNIINAGTLQAANTTQAISFVANLNSIVNTGNIISGGSSTIESGPNVTLANGLYNAGNISNLTVGQAAIDFSSVGTKATYVQQNGIVTGNVNLAPQDSTGGQNVFFMNGGQIIGNVTTIGSSTLALNGGVIAGDLNGGANNIVVNLVGTQVLGNLNATIGNDIFNISGGSYASINGGAGLSTVNFLKSFTSQGYIRNATAINVLPDAVLNLNNPIVNLKAGGTGLTVMPEATFIQNASISGAGSINNAGEYIVKGGQNITLTGAGVFTNKVGSTFVLSNEDAGLVLITAAANGFTNEAGSTFVVDLSSDLQYGHMTVINTGATTLAQGSYVEPYVKGFLPQGAVFDIIQSTAGTVADQSTLIQTSAVVSFIKSLGFNNTNLLLTAQRTPYRYFAIDTTQGLASSLDFQAQGNGPGDANVRYLLGQIDGLSSPQDVTEALASLTPPGNYGLVQASFTNMNNVFERINDRMFDLHFWMDHHKLQSNTGLNAGDRFGLLGLWANVLGTSLDQREKDELAGYDARSGGLAIGADWRYNDCTALGFALSYNKGHVNDKAINPKDESIRSWQATGYGWVDFQYGLYLNTILGVGFNDYHVDRTIAFNQINTSSQAQFNGVQFGLQADAGWILVNTNQYYVTPFARLKYELLTLDHYDETGAGFLSLSVDTETVHEFLGGIGVRLSKPITSKHLLFIPEMTLFLGYDFDNTGEQSTSNFTANSLSFATDGIKPGKTMFDFGLGLNTHINDQSIFTLKYDLELRDGFSANSGYLEYYYLWG